MINRKINELCMSWDSGDQYGCTMAWAFGAADALDAAGEEIPHDWEYSPGAGNGGEYSFECVAVTEAVKSGEITWDDVRTLGNALLRYRAILVSRGESY
jgi:hypothetical protein